MRGTLGRCDNQRYRDGIIPAHAGNTTLVLQRDVWTEDHPRACGEHVCAAVATVLSTGSSPRMRGTLGVYDVCECDVGIIPAHAGNTGILWDKSQLVEDHPRACGEHTSRLAQYRGFLIRSVCFLFSFILSTSLLAGIYWRCSIRDEEHRQKTLPSHWMAV